jgi:hypothetical protein
MVRRFTHCKPNGWTDVCSLQRVMQEFLAKAVFDRFAKPIDRADFAGAIEFKGFSWDFHAS